MAFAFGAIVGSFLNVCIYRIPLKQSVVSPPSSCPQCGSSIRWYQNIPVLSWVLLRGRCAECSMSISARYPLVESLTGALYMLVFWAFGYTFTTSAFWLFVSLLIIVTFIDLDHRIIPNSISLPGVLIGFIASFFMPWLNWSDSLLGVVLGGGSLLLVAVVYKLVAKREGMGMGDVKLLGMIGAFLGWKSIFPIIFVASLVGSIVGVSQMLFKGADSKLALPFGPFLSLASLIYIFWWNDLFLWYQSLYF